MSDTVKFKHRDGDELVEGITVRDVAARAVQMAKDRRDSITFVEHGVPKDKRRMLVVRRLPKYDKNRQVVGRTYTAEVVFPNNGKSRRSRRMAHEVVEGERD